MVSAVGGTFWCPTLLLLGGCHVCWSSENQCWIQAAISLSFACVSPACPQTLIFKASFSGQRDRLSLECPSLWLPEIRPHISNIREGSIGTKKESRWLSQHPTAHNNLNFLFVCVIGRTCGLLISLSSASPNLTHLPYSLLICLLSIILIHLPGELQVESSRRRSQAWPTFKGLSGKTSLKPIKTVHYEQFSRQLGCYHPSDFVSLSSWS